MRVRYCTACDTEYRPEVERCADCGGPLEDHYEGVTAPPPAVGPIEASGPTSLVYGGEASELRPMAARLGEAGIPFRVDPLRRAPQELELRVRSADLDAALALLRDLVGIAAEDADFVDGGYRRCPACRSELAKGSPECPECGLGFSAGEPCCPGCGAAMGENERLCPACGWERG